MVCAACGVWMDADEWALAKDYGRYGRCVDQWGCKRRQRANRAAAREQANPTEKGDDNGNDAMRQLPMV